MATKIPLELIGHTRKIKSLYKRWLRNIEAYYHHRDCARFYMVCARPEFEAILNEKDMIKAKKLIEEKEDELFRYQHTHPKKFPYSPGGVAYEREVIPPDWVLDFWHPLEKAQYPEYFARRELRKQQYIEMWERQYGKPTEEDSHH